MTATNDNTMIRQRPGVTVYPSADEIGTHLAARILKKIGAAREDGRQFLLGCPSGRSLRSTYRAVAELAARERVCLSHVLIVMMDDYVVEGPKGYRYCLAGAHYSCRRFARQEIVGLINAGLDLKRRIPTGNIWLPDPTTPEGFDAKLSKAGGVDLFLLACGASDGHLAFNPPGSSAASRTRIVALAESTRLDNMATFPRFGELSDVPTSGVTVGLQTIAASREVVLVLHGPGKACAARRLLSLKGFNRDWPASIVYRCRNARILLDHASAQQLEAEETGESYE